MKFPYVIHFMHIICLLKLSAVVGFYFYKRRLFCSGGKRLGYAFILSRFFIVAAVANFFRRWCSPHWLGNHYH